METQKTIRTRRTVHEYTDEEVEQKELDEIFETVRRSPSSYNLQPWEFVVVRDEKGKEELKDCAYGQEHVTDADTVVVVFGNRDRGAHAEEVFYDQSEKGYRDDESAEELIERFDEEPYEGNEQWVIQSSMIAATTLIYVAWGYGIASCPMGGWDGDALTDTLDVPEEWYPVVMVTLGYPEKESDEWQRGRKWRRPTEDFVHKR